jgi:hypothetical protein
LPNVTGQYGEVCYLFSYNVLSTINVDKLFTGIPCAGLERKVPNDILVQQDGVTAHCSSGRTS